VNAILSNLEDRGSFDILNTIHDDKYVYEEMYPDLVETVLKAHKSQRDPKESLWHPECE